MPHPLDIGDYNSTLFDALNGFWQQFFRDTEDLQAYYQASEIYLGQVYLDFLSLVLGTSVTNTPIFNREYWKLFAIKENELQFTQGASTAEDRFILDMPGDVVDTDFLQNTIFNPTVLYEKDVDFEVNASDGYARFQENIFRTHVTEDGEYTPTPGIAWRYVTIEVGNNFTDPLILEDWYLNTAVQPGDTLRLLAYRGELQDSGDLARIDYVGFQLYFQASLLSPVVFPDPSVIGDTITVAQAPAGSEAYNGVYVIAEWINTRRVRLELTFEHPTATSLNVIPWDWHHAMYFNSFTRDQEVDYLDKEKIIGHFEDPFPTDLNSPFVYAVVRDLSDPNIVGHPIVTWGPPWTTIFGIKHVVPGSLTVFARRLPAFGAVAVVEGEDYIVDYLRGILTITALGQVQWDIPGSVNRCDYQYREEILFSGSGDVTEQTENKVKQLSLWVPEVSVDRFTLYYNYGSMLNRFEASSETYRAFIRGIMYLYMSGPILQRMEAALNVAAGYPLVRDNEEVLQEYFDGEDDSGVGDGSVLAGDQFTTPSHTFGEIDVGGKIIITNTINDANKDALLIESVVDANTVELQSSFGLVPEVGLDWVLSRKYLRVVTTDKQIYNYPYNVPMREDLSDELNWGVLTFSAFETLTLAFLVTDYIEDPNWWHNKVIPKILWDTPLARRRATDRLVANIIDPADLAQIDDPGLYIDGDDDGVIASSLEDTSVPPIPTPPLRHSVGFIIFDRYMKFHMFYVEFGLDLELDAQFREDLEDIVLVAKPSYTYPYVEANDAFMDGIELLDFLILSFEISIPLGAAEAIELAHNVLLIGGSPTYMSIDDYYRWLDLNAPSGIVPNGIAIPPPVVLVIPGGPIPPEQRVVKITLDATIGGVPVREGVDYTFVYEPPVVSATSWTITPLTLWDAQPAGTDYTALAIEIANLLDYPIPDTTIGFTPIMIDGLDPGYVRRYMDVPPNVATVSEIIDRALSLTIDTNFPGGVPYVYP